MAKFAVKMKFQLEVDVDVDESGNTPDGFDPYEDAISKATDEVRSFDGADIANMLSYSAEAAD